MSAPLLLETICCQDGKLQALPYHERRIHNSQAQLFGESRPLALHELTIPPYAQRGKYKCRLHYRLSIEQLTFEPYRIRPVHSLRLINADGIDYACKYANRSELEACFAQRQSADDVLMVKNGLLTDTYYANIALWDGQVWWTPAKPLLLGTRRAQLLDQERIKPADIRPEDLNRYECIALFNAMMDLGEGPVVAKDHVY
jgi:4-amino-4-deoxychorismate lyase